MDKSHSLHAVVNGLAFCLLGSASASPPAGDPRLLPLVPAGAEIVAGITQGTPASYLTLTRNNATDLLDFHSISGVDPTRKIHGAIFVAATGGEGFLSEHSLLAIGHFDSHHIFKSAEENGATESAYHGVPILIIPPLDRDKRLSHDIRWLAFPDSQIAVFGTVPMVQEELNRSLARNPPDFSLMQKLAHLRSTDQSWCVLTPVIYHRESTRRTLAALDITLGSPAPGNNGLILGIHFDRRVEIEYLSIPEDDHSEGSQPGSEPEFSMVPSTEASQPVSHFLSAANTMVPVVIRFSKKRYDKFVAQQTAAQITDLEQRPNLPNGK